jgi:hypothetical protein
MTATTAASPTTTPARRNWFRRNLLLVIGAAVLIIAASVVIVVVTSDSVPYTDSQSVGEMALYRNGQPVTSGKITDRPFVDYAVSTVRAPAPYDKPGRKAALMAFQAQKGIEPAGWQGDFMTGSTPYSDPNHPTATAQSDDISLANFMAELPVQWDGFIQLRLYLGAPNEPPMSTHYVTADIQVSGQNWKLVRGATSAPGGVPAASPARSGP